MSHLRPGQQVYQRAAGGAIDVDEMKRRLAGGCPDCHLPAADHFRGNGSRFVGCAGAKAKEVYAQGRPRE